MPQDLELQLQSGRAVDSCSNPICYHDGQRRRMPERLDRPQLVELCENHLPRAQDGDHGSWLAERLPALGSGACLPAWSVQGEWSENENGSKEGIS